LLKLWKFLFFFALYYLFIFLDLLGKAKKKILKLDEDILPSDCEGQARVSSASQLVSELQEMGKNDGICYVAVVCVLHILT
jgi:hypothetical protein